MRCLFFQTDVHQNCNPFKVFQPSNVVELKIDHGNYKTLF